MSRIFQAGKFKNTKLKHDYPYFFWKFTLKGMT